MPKPRSNPVILVPGITATFLKDEYPFRPETVWAVVTKNYERVTLHPEDLRYEAIEPARVTPDRLNEVAYEELVRELRHNLSAREDEPTPVFPFPYDWRMPLEWTEARLRDFIDEVIARTMLLRHYRGGDWEQNPRVNLVGHSMGGLVIAGYIARHGAQQKVEKVATLATPFRGSFEAVLKVAVGTAELGSEVPSSRDREAARLTPALYHLVPDLPGSVTAEPGNSTDLFDPAAWQHSIVDTIAEFIRLHGIERTRRRERAAEVFAGMLEQARQFRDRVDRLDLAGAGLSANDWLCVAGVGSTTRVRLHISGVRGKPDFDLRSADRENLWGRADRDGSRDAGQRLTGDGTVPFDGSVPPFLLLENVVCLTPQDFGYWELGDRLLRRVAGFHGILPKMNMAQRLIVRHFTGAADRRGNTWGRPAPGVPAQRWSPAIVGLRNRDAG